MEPNHIILAHSSHINRVLFTADDQLLLSFGFSGELKGWSTKDWSLVRTYEGHTETVNAGVQLGDQLVSVSRDKSMRFFDSATGKLLSTIEDHKKGIDGIVKTKDEQYLFTSGQDLMVVCRKTDGTIVQSLKPNGKNLRVFTTTPDSRNVLVGGFSNNLQVFTIPELEEVTLFEAGNIAITCVCCHPQKPIAWCLDYSGCLSLIDTNEWKVISSQNLRRKGTMGMDYAPERNELAITADKAVLLLDADSLELKTELKSSAKGNYGVDYSHDEKTLALASADKRIRIWELD